MQFDSIRISSQATIPVWVAVGHLALCFYIILLRKISGRTSTRFFLVYLVIAALWNLNLAVIISKTPPPLPQLSWEDLWAYGLIAIGVLYWAFARAFLHLSWRSVWGWLIALLGFGVLVVANIGWAGSLVQTFSLGYFQIPANNINYVTGSLFWGILTAITLGTSFRQLGKTRSAAHRNRVQYLVLCTLGFAAGYGMYLSSIEPFWTTGLIITWLVSVLATYLIVAENLIDLSTGIRLTIRTVVIISITVAVYIAGIYLVQIFLGDFLASTILVEVVNPDLLVAAVTAILLLIVYPPIRSVTKTVMNRLLFGQTYNYTTVISQYSQEITSILDLDELSATALKHIKAALNIDTATIFLLTKESRTQIHFRTLPKADNNHGPHTLTLSKDTPITQRLVLNKQPLNQYSVDISPQFESIADDEREALKAFGFEWFIPILKKEELVGIFGLGPKQSKQAYSTRDMHLLETLADQTALALENASLVHELQESLDEINRVNSLMDNVFGSMHSGVVTTNLEGRITFFNKAIERILALSPETYYMGKHYTEVMEGLENTIFRNLLTNVLEREDRYTDYEIIANHPQRGQVSFNFNLSPLVDAEGKMQGAIIVMDDKTEGKRLQAVRDMFGRYVSPAVVDRLPSDPSELELGGHRQDVTILFADIRGFTAFGEHLTPEKLVDTLNEYLSIAARSILMFEGTLDKFIGDAVMGVFNAPLQQPDHVLRAVRAAATMQQTILNHHKNTGQDRRLSFGIGLHMGEAVVGNIGVSDRMDYTAIGDTVNVAKRIQENTPPGKIFISEAVYLSVIDQVDTVFYKEMKVKGRQQPINIYELLSI